MTRRALIVAGAVIVVAAAAVALALSGAFGGGDRAGGAAGTAGAGGVPALTVATTWTMQDAYDAGSGASLSSVAFADAEHGWAVGYSVDSDGTSFPVILATSDGGVAWTMQDAGADNSGALLTSVAVADAAHGWVIGSDLGPCILATSDGGATWAAQDASSAGRTANLRSVIFADATHGWTVGGDTDSYGNAAAAVILATSDGGATWTAQDASSAGPASLNSVAFADATHGWAVGTGSDDGSTFRAVILATSDGGATWKAQDANGAGGAILLYSVAFADATHGWATGIDSGAGPVILATDDGGATWTAQDASAAGANGSLASIAFVDAAHGWAVGGSLDSEHRNAAPLILATSDGGATWKAQDAGSAGSHAMLGSVAFVDVAHGWAAGELQDDTGRQGVGALILATGKEELPVSGGE